MLMIKKIPQINSEVFFCLTIISATTRDTDSVCVNRTRRIVSSAFRRTACAYGYRDGYACRTWHTYACVDVPPRKR